MWEQEVRIFSHDHVLLVSFVFFFLFFFCSTGYVYIVRFIYQIIGQSNFALRKLSYFPRMQTNMKGSKRLEKKRKTSPHRAHKWAKQISCLSLIFVKPNSQVIKDITVTFILWHIYVYINLTWSLKMFFDSILLLQRWISLIEGGYWSSSLNGANKSVKMIIMIMIIN